MTVLGHLVERGGGNSLVFGFLAVLSGLLTENGANTEKTEPRDEFLMATFEHLDQAIPEGPPLVFLVT